MVSDFPSVLYTTSKKFSYVNTNNVFVAIFALEVKLCVFKHMLSTVQVLGLVLCSSPVQYVIPNILVHCLSSGHVKSGLFDFVRNIHALLLIYTFFFLTMPIYFNHAQLHFCHLQL